MEEEKCAGKHSVTNSNHICKRDLIVYRECGIKRGGGALTALYPSDITAKPRKRGNVSTQCHKCISVSRAYRMSDMPWFKFYPSDWLGGTRGLTAAETGIYISLIAMMYERDGGLEINHARLARLCGASNSSFKNAMETLIREGKIRVEDDLYVNEKALKELSYRREKTSVASKAAKSRWNKKSNEINDSDNADAMRTECERNAIPEARYHIEERDTNVSPKKITPRMVLEEVLDKDHADAALDHRKKLRKTMTVRAAEMMVKNLRKCPDPNAAVDLMVERGWQSVQPDWVKNASQSPPSRANQSPRRETAADVLFTLAERMDNAERSEDDRKAIGFVPSIVNGRA